MHMGSEPGLGWPEEPSAGERMAAAGSDPREGLGWPAPGPGGAGLAGAELQKVPARTQPAVAESAEAGAEGGREAPAPQ
jgi:hypothetical protein